MIETKKAPPEKTYREILLDSRKTQLRLTATNVRRLEITLDAAIASIMQSVESLPDYRVGTPWYRAQFQLMFDIRATMDALRRDYTTLVDVGMVELAQNAADREAEVAKLVDVGVDAKLLPQFSEVFPLTNGQSIPVQFGRLALGAVDRVSTRYYRDGLKLSDRIHKLDVHGRKVIENTITQGIAEQISARDLAKRIQSAMAELSSDGLPPPKHIAMRIARTEIRMAHVETHLMSTEQSPGVNKDYISGVRFNLSASHAESDICDVWAAHDSGAGPGIYLPSTFPVSHPHCLCFSTTVLKAFPDSGVGGKAPDISGVPESMLAYYARQGDQAASALVGAQ